MTIYKYNSPILNQLKDSSPILNQFKDWTMTVGDLHHLLGQYDKMNFRSKGFWFFCCFTYGSTSIKKLNQLVKYKDQDHPLKGKDILNCLSPHRINTLNQYSQMGSNDREKRRNTPGLNGTEKIIQLIFEWIAKTNGAANKEIESDTEKDTKAIELKGH